MTQKSPRAIFVSASKGNVFRRLTDYETIEQKHKQVNPGVGEQILLKPPNL